ncbi:MAG: T9SS type A sorting domain-containing protein [Chitinophagales bacterium]
MNKRLTLFLAMVLCLFANTINAQISITNSNPYTQNFDGLPATGAPTTTNPNPADWLRYGGNGVTLTVGSGTSGTGGFYSAGTGTSTDRAMGLLRSDNATPLYVGAKFVNNTGSTIVSAAVSYKCEQWRRGNTNSGLKDTLLVDYATGTDSVHQGTWINAPTLTGSSTNTGTTAQALDGNAVFAVVSGNITGMAIPNGATFWIRFRDFNVFPGSDDLLAIDSFRVAFTTGTVVSCTEPANSVTNVVATATSTTSISGSFTGTTADGYLVLLDSNATVPTITDATSYAVNDVVGTATVIANGTGTSFSRSGLVPNTIYKVHVFPYNNVSCLNGPNYKTGSPGNDTAKTLVDACPEPTAKPTNLVFKLVNNNNINGKFNKAVPAPNGGYVVVYSTSSNVAYPLDSTNYSIGDSIKYTSFKSKVAYVGTDSNFAISGLVSGTRYYIAVIPFNNCPYGPNYLRTTPLRADTLTSGPAPLVDCVQPTGVSNTSIVNVDSTTTTITVKWRNSANADSVMVIAGPLGTIGFVDVRDTAFYAVNSTIPGSNGKVYYRGTDSTVVLTGLTINTVYKILIASFNNKNCTNGPNYAGLASTTIKTASNNPGDCIQPTGISNNSIVKLDSTATTISIKWTNPANADSVMVVAGPLGTIGFVDIRDTVFYAVNSTIPGSNGKVYYRGIDSTTVLTGLTPNTVYKILIAAFKNKACNFGPNYSGLAQTTVKTLQSVGVKYNHAEAEFALYPNPTNSGMLFIKFKAALRDKASIEIIDVLGRKLSAQTIVMGNELQTIDVSNLAKGTYLLNVIYKDTNNVSTFIVE